MRLCANENLPWACVSLLRNRDDVLWICEVASGLPDEQVLARAVSEERSLITFDKDFGDLVFRRGVTGSCGIVLFRDRDAVCRARGPARRDNPRVARRLAWTLQRRG